MNEFYTDIHRRHPDLVTTDAFLIVAIKQFLIHEHNSNERMNKIGVWKKNPRLNIARSLLLSSFHFHLKG